MSNNKQWQKTSLRIGPYAEHWAHRPLSNRAVGWLAIMVVVLLIIGLIVGTGGHTATGSHGTACLKIADQPALYVAPRSETTDCPDGYEPKRACIVTTATDPQHYTGGCPWDAKPYTWP